MWIEELFVDEFDATHDLSLLRLARGFNLVPMPNADEAHRLRCFVPELVYGNSSGKVTNRFGAVVLRASEDASSGSVYELCRLKTGDATSPSPLQVIESRRDGSEVETTLRRQDVLSDWSADEFNAIFTDRLPLPTRLAIWRKSPWFASLLRAPEATSDEVSADELPIAHQPLDAPRNGLRLAAARRRAIKRALKRGGSPSVSSSAAPSNDTARSSANSLRDEYFAAKSREQQLREQIQSARNELQAAEHHFSVLKQGRVLSEKWQALQELERKISATPTCEATSADVQALRELDAHLVEVRADLQQLRQLDEPQTSGDAERPTLLGQYNHDHESLQASLTTINELLDDWSQCRVHLTRLRDFASRQATDVFSVTSNANQDASEFEWPNDGSAWSAGHFTAAEARRIITQLRLYRQQQRAGDRSLNRESRNGDQRSSAFEARVAELKEAISDAKSQTRELLDRQLLSAETLLGIGVLFSLGVAVVLAAALLDLGSANFGTAAVGVTCLVAAGLLKFSLERPPADRLRQQRLRIEKLMDELQELRATTMNESCSPDAPRSQEAPQQDGLPSIPKDRPLALEPTSYHAFLCEHGIPDSLSPRQAVAWVKQRIQHSSETTWSPGNNDSVNRDHHDQDEAMSELRRWYRRAERTLHRFDCVLPDPFPEGANTKIDFLSEQLREVKRELKRHRESAEITMREHARRHEMIIQHQQRLRELKNERRSLLRRVGAENLAMLESQVQQRQETQSLEIQREQWREEFDQLLREEDDAESIREWLAEGWDFNEQLAQQRLLIEQAKRQLASHQQALQQVRGQIDAFAEPGDTQSRTIPMTSDPGFSMASRVTEHAMKTITMALLRQLLDETERTAITEEHQDSAEPTLLKADASPNRPSRPTSAPSALIRSATSWLHRLTGNRRLFIAWSDVTAAIRIGKAARDDSSTTRYRDFDSLTTDQQNQVILALQFSLWEHLGSINQCLPVLLSDPRHHFDESIARPSQDEESGAIEAEDLTPSHRRFLRTLAKVAEQIPQVIWFGSDVAGMTFLSNLDTLTFRQTKPSRHVRDADSQKEMKSSKALDDDAEHTSSSADEQIIAKQPRSADKTIVPRRDYDASLDDSTLPSNIQVIPVSYWRVDPAAPTAQISSLSTESGTRADLRRTIPERPLTPRPRLVMRVPNTPSPASNRTEPKNIPIEISWDRTGPIS